MSWKHSQKYKILVKDDKKQKKHLILFSKDSRIWIKDDDKETNTRIADFYFRCGGGLSKSDCKMILRETEYTFLEIVDA